MEAGAVTCGAVRCSAWLGDSLGIGYEQRTLETRFVDGRLQAYDPDRQEWRWADEMCAGHRIEFTIEPETQQQTDRDAARSGLRDAVEE